MAILVNIDVPDLAKGIGFYSAAFDMRLLRILDGDVAELVRGDDKFYLLKKEEGSNYSINSESTRDYSRHWTPTHIDFVVENLIDAKKRAVDAGATIESDNVEWRGSKCITFSDPFGHGFCLIELTDGTYTAETYTTDAQVN